MVAATPLAPLHDPPAAPPALGALRTLAARAARPPTLRSLAWALRGARDAQEGYEQFRRLVALLFDGVDEAAILGGTTDNPFADYEGRCSRFARHFEDRWFALWNGEDDLIGYGDGLPYEWVGGGSILEPQGVDYNELAEPDDAYLDAGLLALACLLAPDIDGQEARLDLLLASGALTPALAARLARPAPPPAWRETAVECALWLYAATGNAFLDFALAEGMADYPTVDWHPAASRAPFEALRREYRAALDFHARLGALVREVATDTARFVAAALPRLEAATARYLAGELPLAPDTAEAALAEVVARLYAEDEATGLPPSTRFGIL